MKTFPRALLGAAALGLALLPAVRAADMEYELNCAEDTRLLDTHFARYGYEPNQTIVREPRGFQFRLPALATGVGQTGVYSHFALAGDFELAATFELISASPPEKGYGMTCGIAVDTEGPDGNLSLARGYQMGKINGYIVSRGQRSGAGTELEYGSQDYPSRAQKGDLVLRREKKELVCLVADQPGADLIELCRVPFGDSTIRKVRIFADSGGSPTALNVRLGSIKVQAEEITGGLPKREKGGRWGWWLGGAGLLIAGTGAYVIYRRRQAEDEEDA